MTLLIDADPIAGFSAPSLEPSLTELVGRDELLGALVDRLKTARLVTLMGPGGVGKTRLALALARRVRFPQRSIWVSLEDLDPDGDVVSFVASRLQLPSTSANDLADALAALGGDTPRLLVFDNCEHVAEPIAPVLLALLARAPALRLLCTSRVPLGVPGEVTWAIPPLDLPPERGVVDSTALATNPSVQLFVARARDAQPGFDLTPDTLLAVVRICRRLDGLPLALELAAASLRAMSVRDIASRLDDALPLLRRGPRLLPERHRTLESTLQWSWEQLGEPERTLLSALSVFSGGFSLGAVESVGRAVLGSVTADAVDVLGRLVDHSLVQLGEHEGRARYRLLEPTRQYAKRHLVASGRAAAVLDAHAEWIRELGEEVADRLGERGWWPAPLLAVERDNIIQGLHRLAASSGRAIDALETLDNLWTAFLWTRDWATARQLAQQVLEAVESEGHTGLLRARARMVMAYFALNTTDVARAMELARAAADEARPAGDPLVLARSLDALAWSTVIADPAAAAAASAEVFALEPHIENPLYRALLSVSSPALVPMALRDWELATARYRDAEKAWAALGISWGVVIGRYGQAGIAIEQGQWAKAARLVHSTLEEFPEEVLSTHGWSIGLLGMAAAGTGDLKLSAQLHSAQQAVRRDLGLLPTAWEGHVTDRAVADLRTRLGDAAFDEAWAQGAKLSAEGALILAHQVPTATAEYAVVAVQAAPTVSPRARGPLRVGLMGRLEVEHAGGKVSGSAWAYAKPRELCAYLACHLGGRTREQIGVALWPEMSVAQVKNNLHVTLHHVRRALGDPGFVQYTTGRYRLASDLGVETDVSRFDAAVRRRAWEDAVALWRGPFCDGEVFGSWAEDERDRVRAAWLEALLKLADAAMGRGDASVALGLYQQAVAEDALWEAAHRGVLRALTALGRRGDARRHGQQLVERLWSELGVAPAVETRRLLEG